MLCLRRAVDTIVYAHELCCCERQMNEKMKSVECNFYLNLLLALRVWNYDKLTETLIFVLPTNGCAINEISPDRNRLTLRLVHLIFACRREKQHTIFRHLML